MALTARFPALLGVILLLLVRTRCRQVQGVRGWRLWAERCRGSRAAGRRRLALPTVTAGGRMVQPSTSASLPAAQPEQPAPLP